YDHETTKGGHAGLVPISPVPDAYLSTAIDESPSDFVFPWPDGSIRSPECDPEKPARAGARGARATGRHTSRSTRTQPCDDARRATRSCGRRPSRAANALP